MFDSARGVKDAPFIGVKIGFERLDNNLAQAFALEASFAYAETKFLQDNTDLDAYLARLDMIYPLRHKGKWRPFLSAGGGGLWFQGKSSSQQDMVLSYGAGLRYYFANYLVARVEARQVMALTDEQHNEFEYSFGLTYVFGQEHENKTRQLKDSDHDGVSDGRDRCPDTPEGMKVGKDGCPIDPPDNDGDGIPDYQDKCLDTPEGAPVDTTGCVVDSDGDGVPDYQDQCPSNPTGYPVDSKGCLQLSP